MTTDIIVTRHRPLVDYAIELGLATATTPVLEHAAPEDVRGQVVLGVLPLHLAAEASRVIEIPLRLTLEDRRLLASGDIPLERVRAIAGTPIEYSVCRVHDVSVMGHGDVAAQRMGAPEP